MFVSNTQQRHRPRLWQPVLVVSISVLAYFLWNSSVDHHPQPLLHHHGLLLRASNDDELVAGSLRNHRWEAWKKQFAATYFTSKQDESSRRRIFEANIKWLEARGGSYELDEMAVLSNDEFRQVGKALCSSASTSSRDDKSLTVETTGSSFACPVLPRADILSAFRTRMADDALQTEIIDYRGTQVTPVKIQGPFGTCWSFGFAETIEGLGVRQGYSLKNVSNQEVIDCCPNCRGSRTDTSFGFVLEDSIIHGRLAVEDSYPYRGSPGTCLSTQVRPCQLAPAHVGGCVRVSDDADRSGKPILAGLAILGPAAFGIDAACLRGYKGGVIVNCSNAGVNHEVLLVGAGVDDETGIFFFRGKNSWGPTWGEHGYFRFARQGSKLGMTSVVFATSHPVNDTTILSSMAASKAIA